MQLELVRSGYPVYQASSLSYLIVPAILLVMLFPVIKQQRSFLAERLKFTNLSFRLLCTALLVGVLLRLAYWGHLIGFGALGIYRSADPNALVGPVFSYDCPPIETLLLYVLATALLAPIVEEIINRGFLLYSLLNKGRLFAIVLSSIFFAVMHAPATIPKAFVIGLFLAMFALNSRSLWPPIIAHVTFNGLTALDWLCLNGQWNPTETTIELIRIGVLLLLISVVCLYICSKLVAPKSAGTVNPPQRTF